MKRIIDIPEETYEYWITHKHEYVLAEAIANSIPLNECEDCISRADTIQSMQDKAKKLTNEDTINGLCGAVAILFDLPSVTPQEPKAGHWIKYDEEFFTTDRLKPVVRSIRECSECHTKIADFCGELKYCPNCGTRMERTVNG